MYLISQVSKITGLTKKALRYYDEDCVEIADMELCIPIRKKIVDSSVSCKLLPAVNAVCTTHVGNYETLYLAYKA